MRSMSYLKMENDDYIGLTVTNALTDAGLIASCLKIIIHSVTSSECPFTATDVHVIPSFSIIHNILQLPDPAILVGVCASSRLAGTLLVQTVKPD